LLFLHLLPQIAIISSIGSYFSLNKKRGDHIKQKADDAAKAIGLKEKTPGDKMKDAAKDASDAIEKAGKDMKDSVDHAAHDAAHDAKIHHSA